MTRIFGYGSLVNLRSARRTLPRLRRGDLEPVLVTGFRRIFNLVSLDRRGSVIPEDSAGQRLRAGEAVGVLNAVPDPTAGEVGMVAFEVSDLELAALDCREACYRRVPGVTCRYFYTGETLGEGEVYTVLSAADLRERMPDYRTRVEPLCADGLLSDLILPNDPYLQTCLTGALSWGLAFGDHFLDHTLTADGRRSLRSYLSPSPA